VRGRKGKGENERERGREKGERKEMRKNETKTKKMKEREQGNERTWKSPYNWYSPHSSIVIARSIRGEEQEAQVVHCAEDCGRGGAQEGGVDRAREGVRKGDARVSVVSSEDLPPVIECLYRKEKKRREKRTSAIRS
jgi:hypothetical protein